MSGRSRRRIDGLRQFVMLLRYPFLAHAERRTPIVFTGVEKRRPFVLRVTTTDSTHGLATLHDGDVLMVLAAVLTERHDNAEPLDAPVTITRAELLERLGRPDDGRQRDLLHSEVARLHATEVYTDLRDRPARFCFVEAVTEIDLDGRAALRFTLPNFLLVAIAATRILDVDPGTLALSGLERRVYGWARAFVGLDAEKVWDLDVRQAYRLAAFEGDLRDFALALSAVVTADRLPGYALDRAGPAGSRRLRIAYRLLGSSDPRAEPPDPDELIV